MNSKTDLNCNGVECHQGKDIMESIAEAMDILPCNGVLNILAAAYQEIGFWRSKNKKEFGGTCEQHLRPLPVSDTSCKTAPKMIK